MIFVYRKPGCFLLDEKNVHLQVRPGVCIISSPGKVFPSLELKKAFDCKIKKCRNISLMKSSENERDRRRQNSVECKTIFSIEGDVYMCICKLAQEFASYHPQKTFFRVLS